MADLDPWERDPWEVEEGGQEAPQDATAQVQTAKDTPMTAIQGLGRAVGRAMDRFSLAPVRGAVSGFQAPGSTSEMPGALLPMPTGRGVMRMLGGAAEGFLNPDAVPTSHETMRNLGVSDKPLFGSESRFPVFPGEGVSPAEVAGVGLDLAAPVPGGPMLKLAAKTGRGGYAATRGVGSTFGGVRKEALEMASTKEGREAMRRWGGKQLEIGDELIAKLDDAPRHIPEAAEVEKILPQLGDVDISGTLKSIEEAIKKLEKPAIGKALPNEAAAAKELKNYFTALRGGKSGKFPKTKFDAADVRELRQRLDANIDFDQPWAKEVSSELLKARTQLKNDLIGAANQAGHPEWAPLMEAWSDKLETVNSLKHRIGVRGDKRQRASNLVKRLYNENNESALEMMEDFDKVFGSDITQKARIADYARDFRPPPPSRAAMPGQRQLLNMAVEPIVRGGSTRVAMPAARAVRDATAGAERVYRGRRYPELSLRALRALSGEDDQ